jgi:hypothetical protein
VASAGRQQTEFQNHVDDDPEARAESGATLRLRKFVFGAVWFFVGAAVTILVLVYLASRAHSLITRGVVLRPYVGAPILATTTFVTPASLAVGDQATVSETLHNLILRGRSAKTGAWGPVPARAVLTVDRNCTARPNTPMGQPLGVPGTEILFVWTLSATQPGNCMLTFSTKFTGLNDEVLSGSQVSIPISEHWSRDNVAYFIVSIISFAGLVIAAAISAFGSIKSSRIARGW